jgi:predicted nucleic acid-binding protein
MGPGLQPEALQLLRSSDFEFIAPDFFWLEIANVLSKAVRRRRWTAQDAQRALITLKKTEIEIRPNPPLLEDAFRLSLIHQLSVYDMIYVALALDERVDLITADLRLYNALGALYPVRWLGGWIARH